MEIEKLKDMLRNAAGGPVGIQMCQEAADALEQLQAENDKLKADRDTAITQLHGYCPACKNYTPNHNEGPCAVCEHEYFQYQNTEARDNWEWNGGKEDKL